MPVHDRFGSIPGLPEADRNFHVEPPPQPTPEQIATFRAQMTEEATEKQAAQEKSAQEDRIIKAQELRRQHLHVLFMNDQALLEARVDGTAKIEKAGNPRIVLTIDIQMPVAPAEAAGHIHTPPVIEVQPDSIDVHLDGHAPRPGEIGYDPARPGRVHLEFAVSVPEDIPDLIFHRTEGALFSNTPFPGREMPPLLPAAEAPGIRFTVAAAAGGQAPGFDARQDPGARGKAGSPVPGEESPSVETKAADEIEVPGARIKPFFGNAPRRIPAAAKEAPPSFIPPVIFARQDALPPVAGKPEAAPARLDGGPAPFSGAASLFGRPSGTVRPHPLHAQAARRGDPPASGVKLPVEAGTQPARLSGAPNPFAIIRETEGAEKPAVRIDEPSLAKADASIGPAPEAGTDPVRPEARARAVESAGFGKTPVRVEALAAEKANEPAPPIQPPAVPPAASADGKFLKDRDTDRRRAKAESKDDVVPQVNHAAGMVHRLGSDPVLFNANPVPHATGRSGYESLAREVVQMVQRFLVTADPGSYVKELHMTLNPDILPDTEIRFRMVGQSLTVTIVNKEGNILDRLREEAPELAKALRSSLGADVDIRIESGEGRENL